LALLLLPLALVALLAPVHVHHAERDESHTTVMHACDCGPGETVPVLAGAHHHDTPELCWLAHESAMASGVLRTPTLLRLPPPRPVGEVTPGTPMERLPACRGPPSLLV
jgi:hypothetical protein